MSEESSQVHTTGQEVESTQQGATPPAQPTGETGQELNAPQQAAQEEGKDPNGWAVKRIGQLTGQKHELERKATAALEETARYRQLVEQLQKGEGQDVNLNGAKTPEEIEALVDRRATEKAQQQTMQERGKSVAATGAEAFPDFQAAVVTLDALGVTNDQVQSLLSMDDAHKVIYQLGKNPDEAARILSLPPLQQGRELERLALKSAQPAPKAVSKAPAPITPVDSSVTVETDPSKMSMDEWAKWRAKTAKTRF